MIESEIQYAIRVALGRIADLRIFRNNVGVAQIKGARVRFGLAKGSSDLIGWLTISPPTTPYKIARFVSLEVKTDTGKPSTEQVLWMACVRNSGGFACVVRSVDEALAAIERARNGACE